MPGPKAFVRAGSCALLFLTLAVVAPGGAVAQGTDPGPPFDLPLDDPPNGLPPFTTPVTDPPGGAPPFGPPPGRPSLSVLQMQADAAEPVQVSMEDGVFDLEMQHPRADDLGLEGPFLSLTFTAASGTAPARDGPHVRVMALGEPGGGSGGPPVPLPEPQPATLAALILGVSLLARKLRR